MLTNTDTDISVPGIVMNTRYRSNPTPCELEGTGKVLAIDHVRHWINESNKSTIVLPDSLPVVDIANLMKMGRHSKNACLQSLLSSVNRSNVIFRHNSATAGLNMVPNALSRLKLTTCNSKDCQVEKFLLDLPDKVQCMSTDNFMEIMNFPQMEPAMIAASTAELTERLSTAAGPIPLASRQSCIQVQAEKILKENLISCS